MTSSITPACDPQAEIVPELQQLKVGDLIPMVAAKQIGVWVKELEPNRRMLWWDSEGVRRLRGRDVGSVRARRSAALSP